MEMQDVSKEKERSEGAGEPMLQDQIEEETDYYTQLDSPSKDVYEQTFGRSSDKNKAGKESGANTRLYPAVCVVLGLICLILLLVVIALSVKLQAGSTFCAEHEEAAAAGKGRTSSALSCTFDKCQAYFNGVQPQHCECQQCASGWKAFGRSCFHFSTTRLNWDESLQNCTSRGGSLAIINSPELQSFVAKEGILNYWIGLRRTGAAWRWVDRAVLRESHWVEGPMDGDCGALSARNPPAKSWFKASCQSHTYYICQLDFTAK